ncbi:hypothetical protein EV368DRAFT_64421 [Lentinula lateritia]|nr:hypothetical protein EV368DRAFT_64421 [Lentinula lateritia]
MSLLLRLFLAAMRPLAAQILKRQALDSSSYLLPNRPSASSSALSSSLSQSTVSSSQSDSQVLTANSRIPATAILALLDLLDAFDADVETQVAHLKENIKETPERSNSLDQETVNNLEKRLSQRPEKTDLDKLGQALQQRPKPEELVKEGILLGERNLLCHKKKHLRVEHKDINEWGVNIMDRVKLCRVLEGMDKY